MLVVISNGSCVLIHAFVRVTGEAYAWHPGHHTFINVRYTDCQPPVVTANELTSLMYPGFVSLMVWDEPEVTL
jgi:hypothetical protein